MALSEATTRLRGLNLTKSLTTGIWTVQLNRPERLNALSEDMGEDIINTMREASQTDKCRGVILLGDSRAFSAGRDLKLSKSHDPKAAKRYLDIAIESVLAVYECDVPVCAAIDGHAIGWGFELALAADFRFLGENAQLRLPETSLGLFPGAGGIVLLPRLIGESYAKELIYTARHLNASDAASRGIGWQVQHASTKASIFMSDISDNAPLALRAAKKAIRSAGDVRKQIIQARTLREPLTETHDYREALDAFDTRRKPVFRGE